MATKKRSINGCFPLDQCMLSPIPSLNEKIIIFSNFFLHAKTYSMLRISILLLSFRSCLFKLIPTDYTSKRLTQSSRIGFVYIIQYLDTVLPKIFFTMMFFQYCLLQASQSLYIFCCVVFLMLQSCMFDKRFEWYYHVTL